MEVTIHTSIQDCTTVPEIERLIQLQQTVQRGLLPHHSDVWNRCEEQIQKMRDHRDMIVDRENTTPLSSRSIGLLREVQEQIRKEPEHFHMSWWNFDPDSSTRPNRAGVRYPCQTTTHCIAGWCAVLGAFRPPIKSYTDVLGVTGHQAKRLFYSGNWPNEFMVPYEKAEARLDHTEMAYIACARIDHFINTNGAE